MEFPVIKINKKNLLFSNLYFIYNISKLFIFYLFIIYYILLIYSSAPSPTTSKVQEGRVLVTFGSSSF